MAVLVALESRGNGHIQILSVVLDTLKRIKRGSSWSTVNLKISCSSANTFFAVLKLGIGVTICSYAKSYAQDFIIGVAE